MNFFERQDTARRNSRLLVVLFILAVASIVAAMDLAATVIWYLVQLYVDRPLQGPPRWLHVGVIGGTLALILAVSIRKTLEVRAGGGVAIARMLDARQVVPVKATLAERRLLNVVHEMAIASGSRVPLVYVLDDHGGINAFAAGFDGSLTVVVVTRGALQHLNRDELQAVIGHEFSHIVNGDMSLNLTMIGPLAGLLFIGAAGAHILRLSVEHGGTEPRAWPILFAVGGALFLIGYVGLFCGRAIKAMVAREREFLADAASVQYTRNPEGMAGALDQVRRLHSTVLHLHAEDVSHLFFAEALHLEEERMLSTHPRLEERIRRLAPHFRLDEYRNRRLDPLVGLKTTPAAGGIHRLADIARPWPLTPGESAALVATVAERDVRAATELLRAIPSEALAALERVGGPAALVLALILSTDETALAAELAAVKRVGLEALAEGAGRLAPVARNLPQAWHLPVADLALAELRRSSAADRSDLVRALEAAIDANREVSVYRFAYFTLMRSQLEPGKAGKPGSKSIAALRDDVVLLLSLVAHAGHAHESSGASESAKAFENAMREIELETPATLDAPERCDTHTVSRAMDHLRELAPLAKARVVRALFAAVTTDGSIRLAEAALMRMVGAVLDCPLPAVISERPS